MIDWPQLDELKQVLDIDSDDWDGIADTGQGPTRLSRLLEAAIAYVKKDVGAWDEIMDMPDADLAAAALRRAELMALRPQEVPGGVGRDETYESYMLGHRRRFGVS